MDKEISYEQLGQNLGRLVAEKQAAYGDINKTNALLKMLYPDGIPVEKMDDALLITRILDKVNRIATDRDAFGESPFGDIAGYALLGLARVQSAKVGRTPAPVPEIAPEPVSGVSESLPKTDGRTTWSTTPVLSQKKSW